LGDRLQSGSSYAIGPLPVLSCPVLSCPVCLSVGLSVCLSVTSVYCDKTVGRIKMKLGTQVGLGPSHILLDEDPLLPKRGTVPQFSAHVRCDKMAGRIKMPFGMEVGLGPGDFVLDGDPAPSPKGVTVPQFSAHVYCGQTARCIKMPLAGEVGLASAQATLCEMGTQLPKRGTVPQFSAHVRCGKTAGWIKMPRGVEVGLGPGDIVVDGDPDPQKGGTAPNLWPMSIVAIQMDGSWCHLVRRQVSANATLC